VVRKISIPLTPETAYLRIRKENKLSFLFESVERTGVHGRFSFTGSDPAIIIRTTGGLTSVYREGKEIGKSRNILDLLDSYTRKYSRACADSLPPFSGGWVGHLGYDVVNQIESIAFHSQRPGFLEDAVLGLFTTVVAFDHLTKEIFLIANILSDSDDDPELQRLIADRTLDELERTLSLPQSPPVSFRSRSHDEPDDADRDAYIQSVESAKKYILQGDIFQVVLSRRIQRPYEGDTFHLYRALKTINPSPYMYHFDLGDGSIIGTSPEVLVKKTGTRVEVFPIAGTRKRGGSRSDEVIAHELRTDPKEVAEHVMLVDLGRNDLGRVSMPGTVRVESMMDIVSYSHVMHLESRISGVVREELSPVDVFKATFPAGTVTGAPKIRAMEIIDMLECGRRGPYAGAIGYFDFSGNIDTCIAIRTVFASRGVLAIQAGAGIVFDSVPELEYMETVNKSGAMLEAIDLAGRSAS
jgi:anthranilate synthase component 1